MNLEAISSQGEPDRCQDAEVMAGGNPHGDHGLYLGAVNPSILSASGMDSGAVFTATALALSAIATCLWQHFQSICSYWHHGTECLFCLYGCSFHGIHLGDGTGSRICGRYHLPGTVPDQRA